MALSPKDPDEKVVVTFDFSSLTGTISSPVITVRQQGFKNDIVTMVSGSPQVIDKKVKQMIQGGEDGATYTIRCLITISETGEKFVAKDVLTVKY